MFTLTVRVTRRRAAPRPRPAPPPCDSPASYRSATVASLRTRSEHLATAGGGDSVPDIDQQEMAHRLPLTPFGLSHGGKLAVIFPLVGFQLETHHPTDVLRPDQVFVGPGLPKPTMPPLVSASGHSELSGIHTTRCLRP